MKQNRTQRVSLSSDCSQLRVVEIEAKPYILKDD